ncbi:hypothetical protein B0T24DRAFT_134703 [Lasiosphaeria ovina]|uniref:Uncharacterized protein n=1 Tax=Lasiosphaeria ovina TaxID=92902 RepID=A0AAE0MYT5_9PEZI|nr:hypothetical protein B0T24DRAFT_134703 [Lasiosphaeria ovina]
MHRTIWTKSELPTGGPSTAFSAAQNPTLLRFCLTLDSCQHFGVLSMVHRPNLLAKADGFYLGVSLWVSVTSLPCQSFQALIWTGYSVLHVLAYERTCSTVWSTYSLPKEGRIAARIELCIVRKALHIDEVFCRTCQLVLVTMGILTQPRKAEIGGQEFFVLPVSFGERGWRGLAGYQVHVLSKALAEAFVRRGLLSTPPEAGRNTLFWPHLKYAWSGSVGSFSVSRGLTCDEMIESIEFSKDLMPAICCLVLISDNEPRV